MCGVYPSGVRGRAVGHRTIVTRSGDGDAYPGTIKTYRDSGPVASSPPRCDRFIRYNVLLICRKIHNN